MEKINQYDIIEITLKTDTKVIGCFHSMIDDEIILYIPSHIEYIQHKDVETIKRIKKATDYDTSKIIQFFKHSSYIYIKRYELQDVLHILFEDDTQINATIIQLDDDCLILELENKEKLYINFNYKKELPLGIIQISRNKPLEEDVVDESVEEIISYNIDESKCKYTLNIQINAILQYLNFTKKYNGELFAQRYKELMLLFPYGEPLLPDQSNFKWIYPITNATININNLDKNIQFKKSLTHSLMCYKKLELTNKDKQYNSIRKFIHSIFRVFNDEYPVSSTIQSYVLPSSKIMMYKQIKGSKEDEHNWVPKIQHWNNYTTDELLPVVGYTSLPPNSILFSKLYLPETSLTQKIQINLQSHYHFFNLKCEPTFTFKEIVDYKSQIPSIRELITTLKYYSLHDFIKQLEPYHIYANHISYENIQLIQSYISKHKKIFLSNKQLYVYTNTTPNVNKIYDKLYVSTSELYHYTLTQDYGNAFIMTTQPTPPIQDEPSKPSKNEPKFIIEPFEPICEIKNDCNTNTEKQLSNHLLTNYHTSDVTVLNHPTLIFLQNKKKYNEYQKLKYNTQHVILQNDLHSERPPQSYEMFYQIMSFPLKRRYTALLQFITKYTKINESNPDVFYCSTTNIVLMPVILKTLAETYLTTTLEEYYNTLYKYCTSSNQVYVEDGFYKDKNTSISLAPILHANSYDELAQSSVLDKEIQHQVLYTKEQQRFINILSMLCAILINQTKLNQLDYMFINDIIISNPNKIFLYFLIYIYHIKLNIVCENIAQEIVKSIPIIEKNDPSLLQQIGKKIVVSEIKRICNFLSEKYKSVVIKPTIVQSKEWKTFMPSFISTYPVLESIKTQLQKGKPIHMVNDEPKRVNNTLIEFKLKDEFPRSNPKHFYTFVNKYDMPIYYVLDFSFNIPKPLMFDTSYKSFESIDLLNYTTTFNIQEIQLLQTKYAKYISIMKYHAAFKYPSIYLSNYIKTILQFYTKIFTNNDFYDTLKDDCLPITHLDVIARSHFENITKKIENYYKDPPTNKDTLAPIWSELYTNDVIQHIMTELKQPLLHKDMHVILFFYLLTIFKQIHELTHIDTPLKYISKKFNSELNIPDYDELKKKINIRQSLERKNVVTKSKQLSDTEKLLTSIQTNLNTSTKYNVPQFTSRLNEALLFQGVVNKDAEGDAGDDGNMFDT